MEQPGFIDHPEGSLVAPQFRSLETFVKWAVIVCGLGMIFEGSFLMIYILVRFGWAY